MSCCAWHNRIVYKNVWKNTGMVAYGVLLILYWYLILPASAMVEVHQQKLQSFV